MKSHNKRPCAYAHRRDRHDLQSKPRIKDKSFDHKFSAEAKRASRRHARKIAAAHIEKLKQHFSKANFDSVFYRGDLVQNEDLSMVGIVIEVQSINAFAHMTESAWNRKVKTVLVQWTRGNQYHMSWEYEDHLELIHRYE